MTYGGNGDPYDPTGSDSALPTVDSGWPAAYDPSGDSPQLTPTGPRRRHGLGLFALVLAILVIVATIIVSVVLGRVGAHYATNLESGGVNYDLSGDRPGEATLAIETGFQYIIGTILGLWAIIQGIVAIAKNRGRLFGVLAIIIAIPGPVVSLVVSAIVVGQNLPN